MGRGVALLIVAVFQAWATPAYVVSPNDDAVHFLGRHTVNATAARFDWVGTGFTVGVRVNSSELPRTLPFLTVP